MKEKPQGNSAPLSSFDRVSKWYGPVIGLNDASLDLSPEITGLVGPNGAGKSTLIKLLTGQLRPSLGEVTVRGMPAWSAKAKSHIGYCPDADAFYEEMSGRAFVSMIARLHGLPLKTVRARAEDVLSRVGMDDRADRPLGSYSKGMRQRIKLAQALVHDPKLIVLDEPLNGVDPIGRQNLVNLLRELASSGKAILVSSHILDEMDRLADRVLFIYRGRILASGNLRDIRRMLEDHPLQVRVTSKAFRQVAADLVRQEFVQAVELHARDELVLKILRPTEFFESFSELVLAKGYDIECMEVMDESTEAVFDYLLQASGP